MLGHNFKKSVGLKFFSDLSIHVNNFLSSRNLVLRRFMTIKRHFYSEIMLKDHPPNQLNWLQKYFVRAQ